MQATLESYYRHAFDLSPIDESVSQEESRISMCIARNFLVGHVYENVTVEEEEEEEEEEEMFLKLRILSEANLA